MRRQFRELDQKTKDKISRSTTGKPKTAQHKQNISQALRKYWSQIPHKPTDLSMDEFLGR